MGAFHDTRICCTDKSRNQMYYILMLMISLTESFLELLPSCSLFGYLIYTAVSYHLVSTVSVGAITKIKFFLVVQFQQKSLQLVALVVFAFYLWFDIRLGEQHLSHHKQARKERDIGRLDKQHRFMEKSLEHYRQQCNTKADSASSTKAVSLFDVSEIENTHRLLTRRCHFHKYIKNQVHGSLTFFIFYKMIARYVCVGGCVTFLSLSVLSLVNLLKNFVCVLLGFWGDKLWNPRAPIWLLFGPSAVPSHIPDVPHGVLTLWWPRYCWFCRTDSFSLFVHRTNQPSEGHLSGEDRLWAKQRQAGRTVSKHDFCANLWGFRMFLCVYRAYHIG